MNNVILRDAANAAAAAATASLFMHGIIDSSTEHAR